VASDSGQLAWPKRSPCQPCSTAALSSATRHTLAWLSPITAIVPVASCAGMPNSQMSLPTNAYCARHGGFFCLRAVSGEGTTESFSAGFAHGFTGSRAAAPKQAGSAVCARDDEPPASRQAATSTSSPSRRKAPMIAKPRDACDVVAASFATTRPSRAAAGSARGRGAARGR
jgi:hypothetical protein